MRSITSLPYYCFSENEWETKLEGRYWNPQGQNICVVAIITRDIDWAAYIGACPSAYTEEDALGFVSSKGAKLSEKDARYFFPKIELPYRA